jgi:hypothetical protein
MVETALRGVVRDVLNQTARDGLSGDHHFYLTFRTNLPGVEIPDYLRERFKEEMTIVIQHQFWDLVADDRHFALTLSFNGKPENLSVPFSALTGFFDPSVQFGLQFQLIGDDAEKLTSSEKTTASMPATLPADAQDTGESKPEADNPEADNADGNVVTLDQFRKT